MEVTFLGTGSAMQSADRAQTGILVTAGDRRLLVDCGSGVLRRLQQVGGAGQSGRPGGAGDQDQPGVDAPVRGYEDVGHVLLTHHHLDHCSDLLALLKARWLAGAESLSVAGPPGTEALVDDLLDVHDYLRDRVDLEVRDVEPPSFTFAGFDVAAMETRHSMQCFAYRFGDAFAFSGDSEAFADLADFADGCAVVAHDCSFPDGVDVSNHPTPSSLGRALEGVDVGTVYLTHLYPQTGGRTAEMAASVTERFDGTVEVAEDLQTVRI